MYLAPLTAEHWALRGCKNKQTKCVMSYSPLGKAGMQIKFDKRVIWLG